MDDKGMDGLKLFLHHAAIFIAAVLIFLVGFVTGRECGERSVIKEVEVKTDTLFIRDTITKIKPVPQVVRKTDTMQVYVHVHDTIREVVTIPKEVKVYEDTAYRAVVSGYRPALEEISVYPVTKVVIDTRVQYIPKKTRWGVGFQASYGATVVDGRFVDRPFIGLGISWNFINW